ncbi:Zn(2)-C6 fungal-type transcription factor mpsB [Exophiala dermatitidis]
MAEFSSLTHKFRANIDGFQAGGNKIIKRNRQPLSCAPCRSKKLKCDRGHPCEPCVKRGDQNNCIYGKTATAPVTAPARPEAGSGNSNGNGNDSGNINTNAQSRGKAQERLRRLEELVMRMVDDNARASLSSSTSIKDHGAAADGDGNNSPGIKSGGQGQGHDETTTESDYVRSTHWSAILENIQELKTALGSDLRSAKTAMEEAADDGVEPQASEDLFKSAAPLSLSQILAQALPPRVQVDRRLSTYFTARYMMLASIHVPSFQRQYEQFWRTPLETSPLWISILFSVCCISATLTEAVGSEQSTPLEDGGRPSPRMAFLTAAGQCLQLGGYVRPKKYAVEALAIYAQCTYMATIDPSREVGALMGILVRLAYRSGYHRDPSHFPHLGVFEGEMRRRTWAMLQQCDLMTSFQMGLPNLIPPSSWDTQLPRNLLDSDFDEHTTTLPPSRPPEDPTPLLYFIAKSRLMTTFGKICAHVISFRESSQEEIMALDAEMRAVYASTPEILRIRPMAQSYADPAYLVMVRLNCAFLYQKSLCVLHRKYMTQGWYARYPASTQACLDAATAITKHMLDLHKELQPGGQLYNDRWMLSSFTMNDFYLACMVLCLGLSIWKKANPGKNVVTENEDLFKLLKAAFAICEECTINSNEARRVTDVLRVVLRQMGSDDTIGEGGKPLASPGKSSTITSHQQRPQQHPQQLNETRSPMVWPPKPTSSPHQQGTRLQFGTPSTLFPWLSRFNLDPADGSKSGATSSSTQDEMQLHQSNNAGLDSGSVSVPGSGPGPSSFFPFSTPTPTQTPSNTGCQDQNQNTAFTPDTINPLRGPGPDSASNQNSTLENSNTTAAGSADGGGRGIGIGIGLSISDADMVGSGADTGTDMNWNLDWAMSPSGDFDWALIDQWMALPPNCYPYPDPPPPDNPIMVGMDAMDISTYRSTDSGPGPVDGGGGSGGNTDGGGNI